VGHKTSGLYEEWVVSASFLILGLYSVFMRLMHFSVNSLLSLFLLEDFTKFIKANNFSYEYVDPNIVNRAFASFFIDTKLFGKETYTFNIIFSIFCTTFRHFCFCFGNQVWVI